MTIPKFGNAGLDVATVLLIAGAVLIGLPILGELVKPSEPGAQASKVTGGGVRAAPVNW